MRSQKVNVLLLYVSLFFLISWSTKPSAMESDNEASKAVYQGFIKEQLKRFSPTTYCNDGPARLRNFLESTSNPQYKSLKFAQLQYNNFNNQHQWSYKPILSVLYPIQIERGNQLVHFLNTSPEFFFESNFCCLILLSEPTYAICDTTSFDQVNNDALSAILEEVPVLSSCSHQLLPWTQKLILIPDFYTLFFKPVNVSNLLNTQLPAFEDRDSKIFFSGAISGYPYPFTLENMRLTPRLSIFDKMDEVSYLEAVLSGDYHLKEPRITNLAVTEAFLNKHENKKKPPCDFCAHANYKYLLSLDGFGAAWGRVPAILATSSVLIMQTEAQQWFYYLLKPYENYIPLKKDLSNLDEIFRYLEEDPQRAKEIGQKGRKLAESFLTEPMLESYFLQIFNTLRQAQPIYHFNNMMNIELVYQYAKTLFNTGIDQAGFDRSLKKLNHQFLEKRQQLMKLQFPIELINNHQLDHILYSVCPNMGRNFFTDFTEFDQTYKIPLCTHRIWITDLDQPMPIPEKCIKGYRESFSHWSIHRHHFWCIDKSKLQSSVTTLESFGIIIHELKEIEELLLTRSLIRKLLKDKLYGFASNLLRLEILYQFGGLYADIGLIQQRDIQAEMKEFDALFYLKGHGELDVCAMAFAKGCEFLKMHLEFIASLNNLPANRRVIYNAAWSRHAMTTSYGQMALLPAFLETHPDFLVGFLQQNKDFKYNGLHLWGTESVQKIIQNQPYYFYEFE